MTVEITKEVIDQLILNFQKNLEKGRAGATGIGVFAAIIDEGSAGMPRRILLRERKEKGSLYGQDLSGKKELPGGGMELGDFILNHEHPDLDVRYTGAFFRRLCEEIKEETEMILYSAPDWPYKLLPASIFKDGKIDLAFVIVIPFHK
ncbi:MAG: hypothetical protein Q8O39_00330, partial [bacterium]|nr:hypothetical protein [bacterium]